MTVNSGNTFDLRKGFVSAGLAGSGVLNKSTSGTVTLAGSGTYTGVTNVTSGTLVLGHANALGAISANTIVSNGAGIDINGQNPVPEPVTINGTGSANSYGALTNTSGIYGVWSGDVTMGSNATIAAVTNWTISGALAGAYTLTKDGPGVLALTNTGTSTRSNQQTIVKAGTLRLGAGGVLGTGTVNLNGGILNLAVDAGATFNFGVTFGEGINSGIIEIDRATYWGGGPIDTINSLSIGGQTLTVRAGRFTNTNPTLNFNTTTLTGGNPTFAVDPNSYEAAIPVLSLGAVNFGADAKTILKTGRGQLTISGAATSAVNGTTVNVNGGTLYLGHATALGALAVVNLNVAANTPASIGDSSTAGYLVWHAVLGVGANTTIGALNGPGTVLTGAGFTLTIGGANNLNSDFFGVFTGTQINYTGTTGALTKAGSGLMTFGGFNYNTGKVTVSSGTLRALDNAGVLGPAAVAIDLATGSTLDLRANGSPTFLAAGALTLTGTGSATINVGANGFTTGAGFAGNGSGGYNVLSMSNPLSMGTQTLTVTGDTNYGLKITGIPTFGTGTTSTFSVATDVSLELSNNVAAGNGAITKEGGGLLILSGNNAHTGLLTVSSGTVRGTQANSFGQGAASIALAGGNLDLRNNAATPNSVLFGRNVVVSADATIKTDVWAGVSGYNTNPAVVPIPTAAISHSLGTLSIGAKQLNVTTGNGVGLNFGATTITGNATFNVGPRAQLTLGSLNGTNGFTKTGDGLMILNAPASATYSSSTPINVNGGTLRLSDGLVGQYYNMGTNTDFTGSLATFNTVLATSGVMSGTVYENGTRTTLDFANVYPGFPAVGNNDNFQVKWTGWFYVPVTGNYVFATNSDDTNRVWFDGVDTASIIDDGSATMNFTTTGYHQMTIGYREGTSNQSFWMNVSTATGAPGYPTTAARMPLSLFANGMTTNTAPIAVNAGGTLELASTLPAGGSPVTLYNGSTLRGFGPSGYSVTAGLTIAPDSTVDIQTGSNVVANQVNVPLSYNDVFTIGSGLNGGGGTGAGSAVKLGGSGRLVFSSSGTYTGAVNVNMANGGLVLVNNATALGVETNTVTINSGVLDASVDLAYPIAGKGGALGAPGATARTFTGGITLGAGTSTQIMLVDPSNFATSHDVTISTNGISGDGNLVVSGYQTFASTLTLAAPSTYGGSTTINAGTLKVTGAGTLTGTNGFTILSGGKLWIDNGSGTPSSDRAPDAAPHQHDVRHVDLQLGHRPDNLRDGRRRNPRGRLQHDHHLGRHQRRLGALGADAKHRCGRQLQHDQLCECDNHRPVGRPDGRSLLRRHRRLRQVQRRQGHRVDGWGVQHQSHGE